MIGRIACTIYFVPGFERSMRFYEEVRGLDLVMEEEGFVAGIAFLLRRPSR